MQTGDLLDRWWPLQCALDVVHGPVDVVVSAVLAEVTRFVAGDPLSTRWMPFGSLGDVFGSVSVFTNVPTVFFVLPTHSDWSVLWNNSFLCDGYDSLCHCLTLNHGLTTVHWKASDEDAVFQAGTSFSFRRRVGNAVSERSVYCCRNDGKWEFGAVGEPLPSEDLARYASRVVRDRLDETGMMQLLARLGIRPRDADFYKSGKAFRADRTSYPNLISRKRFSEFACPRRPVGG